MIVYSSLNDSKKICKCPNCNLEDLRVEGNFVIAKIKNNPDIQVARITEYIAANDVIIDILKKKKDPANNLCLDQASFGGVLF